MGVDDVQVKSQQECKFLYDQKHQDYMRAALDMVCQVENVQSEDTKLNDPGRASSCLRRSARWMCLCS